MMLIRQATVADAGLVAHLGRKSFLESHGHSASPKDIEFYVSTQLSVRVIRQELSNRKYIFHIIYYQRQPAGYSKIIFNELHTPLQPSVAKLERLYLLEGFHNLKLGLRLLKFLVILCRQKKQEGMWLFVWKENERAIGFYKQFGFEVAGTADFKISDAHSNPNYSMLLTLE